MPADDRPDAWEMRPPTQNRAMDPVMKQPQMPMPGGILPPGVGAPALPGPGAGGGPGDMFGSDMLRQIMMMILGPQLRQFMGGGTGFGESKFTPGGPSIPGGENPNNPLMRLLPMPNRPNPGYGINPPNMLGGNPIADAQGMQGNMQGPMSFLAPMMRVLQQMQSGGGGGQYNAAVMPPSYQH